MLYKILFWYDLFLKIFNVGEVVSDGSGGGYGRVN